MNASDPHARLRVAIYAADGSVRGLLSGTLATVLANTPPGGTWRAVPASVRRIGDVRRAGGPSVGSNSSPKGRAS